MSEDLIRIIVQEILHARSSVVVYHASPQLGLQRIMPRYSPKFRESGVFVSDSLDSIWNSWASWAMRKPDKTGTGRTSERYGNIAVYTIKIPRNVFEEAKKRHDAAAAQAPSLGAWGWDIETFIPEDLMTDGSLTPSSVKVYTRSQIEDIERYGKQWKSAGRRPEEFKIPSGSKNPAREILRNLRSAAESKMLRRGKTQEPSGRELQGLQFDLQELFAQLEKLASKTRLTSEEKEDLEEVKTKIENLLKLEI